MASQELLQKIYSTFNAYIGGTANLDEAFADIKHFLNGIAEPERTAIIRDELRPFALESDFKKGPPTAGQSLGIAMGLLVRLWAAVGRADEIPADIFTYIKTDDRKWHKYWATVLHEMRFSTYEYRARFSERAIAGIAKYCLPIERSDAEELLKTAAEGLRNTIDRIQYELGRPKTPKKAAEAAPAKAKPANEYGPWTDLKSLSEGGQAHTFLVKRDGQGPQFVLKRLKNAKRVDRFRKEINAGLALDHPNIVKVFDHHLESEPYYFVSEYCEKGALRGWDGLSRLSIIERLRLFLQICAGVAFAHTRYIVHRDLKPDNIFVRTDGSLAVGDFGICFITDDDKRPTLEHEAVGPRNYIAPELEDGRVEEVRLHSDVYSLGKVLYWTLTGREFAREKHREAGFDLTKKNRTGEYFLIYELLDQMIVADPAKRFKNANDLAFAVEALIERIQAGGRVMDLSAPQKCLYCGDGYYKVIAEPLYGEERKAKDDAETFAHLGGVGIPLWGVFVCDHCGNVQLFRPDRAKDPKVWKKS